MYALINDDCQGAITESRLAEVDRFCVQHIVAVGHRLTPDRAALRVLLMFMLVFTTLAGCQRGPTRVRPVDIDEADASARAIEQYDSDGDGQLSYPELKACPGIFQVVDKYDQNQDGYVTQAELKRRFQSWRSMGLGIRRFGVAVIRNGQPIDGATVHFVPESFLGDAVKPAQGVTDRTGVASLSVDAEFLPEGMEGVRGVTGGVYKIQIEHPSVPIPARFHSATILGEEIARDVGKPSLVIDIGGG